MTVADRLYDPLYHTPQDDLYEVYDRLRNDYPVYHCTSRGVWCLTRFDDVQNAARDWQTFSSSSGVDLDIPPRFFGSGVFLEEDPPRHDVLRKIVRPFFVPKEIAKLEAQIERRVDTLARRIPAYEIEEPVERVESHILRGFAHLPAKIG